MWAIEKGFQRHLALKSIFIKKCFMLLNAILQGESDIRGQGKGLVKAIRRSLSAWAVWHAFGTHLLLGLCCIPVDICGFLRTCLYTERTKEVEFPCMPLLFGGGGCFLEGGGGIAFYLFLLLLIVLMRLWSPFQMPLAAVLFLRRPMINRLSF